MGRLWEAGSELVVGSLWGALIECRRHGATTVERAAREVRLLEARDAVLAFLSAPLRPCRCGNPEGTAACERMLWRAALSADGKVKR